ncbi:hypothetical protein Tco_0953899 [Tanacetum coccineum]|uniref:Uncharacterized protein n=1 Tax=Tanacetum coccineum TaxID=301880 RepID=A0ABQ5E279_9ASTR
MYNDTILTHPMKIFDIRSVLLRSESTAEPSRVHNRADDEPKDEMPRLQGLGSNTETGVPYTEDEIMAIVRGGKQRGHIPGIGRVFPGQRTVILPSPPCTHSSDVAKLKKREKVLTRQVNMFMKLFRSDEKPSLTLRPHMESDRWPLINVAIQQHLQKIYNGKKAALKEKRWIPDSDGTYNLERIRQSRPSHISEDELLRLQGLGSNTETGVPYTEDEIMAIDSARSFRPRLHASTPLMFSQMLSQLESQPEIGGGSRSGGCGDDEQGYDEDDSEDEEDEDDS